LAGVQIFEEKRRGRPPGKKAVTASTPVVKAKKSGFSAEHRAKLAAAQKARWAKKNAAKAPVDAEAKATPAPKKKKGGISPEGLARIKAAQKLRWAKVKAEKSSAPAKAAPAPKKKKGGI
jgi:hypothetical protein